MSKFTEGKGAVYYDILNHTVGALAAGDCAVTTMKQDGSRQKGFRVLKSEYNIQVLSMTGNEALVVGVGGPYLSAAQIEEALEADPQQHDHAPDAEQSMRPLWILGILDESSDPLKGEWKPRWSFPEGAAMNFFVYNPMSGAITTGATVVAVFKHFGVWLND